MTEAEISDWQCKMHLWSTYLYEVESRPALDDDGYDKLCQQLLRSYANLPSWFTERVTQGGPEDRQWRIARRLSPEEIVEARWWRDQHIPAMRAEVEARRVNWPASPPN